MAGVNSTVRINDGMSPALKSMNKALNIVLSSFERLQSVSGNAIDTTDIANARAELNNAAVAVSKVEDELRQAERQQEKFTQEVHNSGDAMSGLMSKVTGLIATYAGFQTLMNAVNLSDQMTQTESRMALIVDVEAGESVDELTDKIMASANRSRAGYLETANAVTSFAQRAGDAFANNDEVIAFTETLNKMYVIAGASAEEQNSSMLQLTQALGSGVLRGEEFNAVFEAAPNIMQAVADYMQIPLGELRSMAEEGKITADIVKNAIFSATEEVNADFESMSMTWGQVFTLFKNNALESFDPVLRKINELANNPNVQKFVNSISAALPMVANVILKIFELVASVGSFIYDNWSIIEPLIMGAVTALGLYYGAMIAYNTITGIAAFVTAIHSAMTSKWTFATFLATAQQHGFNAALAACPIAWIVLGIIAIIAVLLAICNWLAKTGEVAGSAFGVMTGGVNVVIQFFKNLGAQVANIALGIGNALGAVAENMMIAFSNAIANIQGWFYDLLSTVVDTIAGIAESLSALPFVEFDYEGLYDAAAAYEAKSIEAYGSVEDYTSIADAFNEGMSTFDTFQDGWVSDAFESGANWGDGIADKVSGLLDGMTIPDAGIDHDSGYTPTAAALEDIAGNTEDIAGGTSDIADSLELTEEDLKYMKDLAEQEAINRFTTAEIKIDMNNNNNINSNMDLDGMVSYLEDKLYESMEIAAEGVHE